MTRTLLAMLFFLVVLVFRAQADLLVKDYRAEMASGDQERIALTKIYIRGVGEGIVTANAKAMAQKMPLFCQPTKLALGEENFLNILNDVISTISTRAPQGRLDQLPVAALLLQGLQSTFPCATK